MRDRRSGFTLLEMMIVLVVLVALIGLAVPNWVKAKGTAANRTCLANLRQIEIAKEQLSVESRRGVGVAVDMSDLVPEFLKERPECPSNGVYKAECVGTRPTCSIADHQLP